MNSKLITAIIVTLLFIRITAPNSYVDDDNPYEGKEVPILSNSYKAM